MTPKFLQKGDVIAIIAPAKKIEKEHVEFAVQTIEKHGYKAIISKHCLGANNYFSGTIEERQEDLQWAINHPEVKAILCARGGYGCIQIIDLVNWASFFENPKWFIGFSDITVFHQFFATHNLPSLHATVPLNFQENSEEAIQTLFGTLETGNLNYEWGSLSQNRVGSATGKLVGGNLTVLATLIGTDLMPDYSNTILFIEDIGEALYAIDRTLHQLKRAGVLSKINGLIVGDFSALKDSEPPYGEDLETIIASHFIENPIPIAFGFPAGHCSDNRALILGSEVRFEVKKGLTVLENIANQQANS